MLYEIFHTAINCTQLGIIEIVIVPILWKYDIFKMHRLQEYHFQVLIFFHLKSFKDLPYKYSFKSFNLVQLQFCGTSPWVFYYSNIHTYLSTIEMVLMSNPFCESRIYLKFQRSQEYNFKDMFLKRQGRKQKFFRILEKVNLISNAFCKTITFPSEE